MPSYLKMDVESGEVRMHDVEVRNAFLFADSVMLEFQRHGVRVAVSLPVATFAATIRRLAPELRDHLTRTQAVVEDMREVDALLAALPMAEDAHVEIVGREDRAAARANLDCEY